jgi:hypothetical protein
VKRLFLARLFLAEFIACLMVGAGLVAVGQFNPFTAGLALGVVSVMVLLICARKKVADPNPECERAREPHQYQRRGH